MLLAAIGARTRTIRIGSGGVMLAELRAYLADTAAITARPVTGCRVPVHFLATGRGLEVAARLGLPVVVGGPVLDSAEVGDLMAAYRRDFRPHEGSTPSVTVSLDVTVAATDAEARDLALPEAWAMVRSPQTGEFAPLEPVDAIRAQPWSCAAASSRRSTVLSWAARPRSGEPWSSSPSGPPPTS